MSTFVCVYVCVCVPVCVPVCLFACALRVYACVHVCVRVYTPGGVAVCLGWALEGAGERAGHVDACTGSWS